MKRRELLLVAGLILFGLIYHAVEKGRLVLFGDFSDWRHDSRLLSKEFAEFQRPRQRFERVVELAVNNPAGEVEVTQSPDAAVTLDVRVRVYHDRKSEADKIARTIDCQAVSSGDKLRIDVKTPGEFPLNRARVLLQVQIPAQTKLAVSNRFGDLRVRNVGRDVTLNESFGHTFAENIPSSLRVDNRHGNLLIKGVAGRVVIHARYADIDLEEVEALQLENSHGKMVLKRIRGHAAIDHAYGGIFLDGAEDAEVVARHAPLTLRNVRKGLRASNSFESIELTSVAGDIQLSGRYCAIRMNRCAAGAIVISNSYNPIELADISAASLDITQKHGKTRVELTELRERLNVDTSHADVELILPAGLKPSCSLKARFGAIVNEAGLPLKLFSETSERSASCSGQKGEIVVSNRYGNILLRRLANSPEKE